MLPVIDWLLKNQVGLTSNRGRHAHQPVTPKLLILRPPIEDKAIEISKLLDRYKISVGDLDSSVPKEVVISSPRKVLKAVLDEKLNLSELKFLMVLQLSFLLEEIKEVRRPLMA
jgi:hypothetical protein